jgi:hypothetical protein
MALTNPFEPAKNPLSVPLDLGASVSQAKVADASGLSFPVNTTPLTLLNDPSGFTAAAQNVAALKSSVASDIAQGLGALYNIYGVRREPWVFATFQAIMAGTGGKAAASVSGAASSSGSEETGGIVSGPLFWTANPKSVTWQISQRGTEAKNKSGTVLHIYRDRLRKSDYDDPKLNIQFQSGSILPQASLANSASKPASATPPTQIASGLNDFYAFLQLVDQPKITPGGDANVIHILYRSRIFPSIVITGFFDPQVVVQFTDDSQNPNMISSWSANFTVYSTTPRLKSFSQLTAMFTAEGLEGFKSNVPSSFRGG